MQFASAPTFILALWLSCPIPASTRIAIGSIPLLYTPTEGPEIAERLSMGDYHFEVIKEKTRARVVVDYAYPDEMLLPRTGDPHLPSSSAQIPGLRYDRSAQKIIFEAEGKSTVCATVQERKRRFGDPGFKVTNTGYCTVEAGTANHAKDDGWTVRQIQTLDTYLVVR